jgi:transcription termination/antitermination protein NusG
VTEKSGAMSDFYRERSHEPTIAGAPIEPVEPSWFAVHTRPRHEKKVELVLQEKGIQAFLPVFGAKHQWSDRRRIVHSPLFPGYVFTRIVEGTDAYISVLRTAGVVAFVGIRGKALAIPDQQIEAVQAILDGGISLTPHPFLHAGQRVRIRGGCLDGLQGILQTKNGDQSLIVSVDMIQRALAIRVAGYRVEPI